MATMYKTFLNNDTVSTRTLLHEAIPITGSMISGTYNEGYTANETNVRNYAHGQFQAVYDYPYLSSSANHIFDITFGYHTDSPLSGTTNRVDQSKKINIYNQMAQTLMGHDKYGRVLKFDEDGDLTEDADTDTKLETCYFLNFSRLVMKDEIKKGSFSLELGVNAAFNQGVSGGTTFSKRVSLRDLSGSTSFLQNSVAGEYGILYATSSANGATYLENEEAPCGLIFYQAGVAVISGSVFYENHSSRKGLLNDATMTDLLTYGPSDTSTFTEKFDDIFTGSAISGIADNLRNRIYNLSFNNTTELNSTIYFCRVNHNEFNYSANPTYLNKSKIRVKESTLDLPTSYVTTIGLYAADRELLAVAKLSEPLKKDPNTELTLRVRLDY